MILICTLSTLSEYEDCFSSLHTPAKAHEYVRSCHSNNSVYVTESSLLDPTRDCNADAVNFTIVRLISIIIKLCALNVDCFTPYVAGR